MGNDKSLKNEFEDNFEKRKLSDQPAHTKPAGERDVTDDFERSLSDSEREARRTERDARHPETGAGYTGSKPRTIPVIEEEAHVGKRVVETGKVLISKKLYDEEMTLDLPTTDEEVDVQRVEVNEYVETMPPPIRYEGDVTIIPVLKEVAVVEKRILLVEEIHIRKRRTTSHDTQPIRLRKEEVDIKRKNPDGPNRV